MRWQLHFISLIFLSRVSFVYSSNRSNNKSTSSTNQQQPLVSIWTMKQLAALLEHPELLNNSNHQDDSLSSAQGHTISFGTNLNKDQPSQHDQRRELLTRKRTPKKRGDLDPLEPIAAHRYLKYDNSVNPRFLNSGNPTATANARFGGDKIDFSSPDDDSNPLHEGYKKSSETGSDSPIEESDVAVYQPIRIHFDASELHDWKATGDEHTKARIDYLINKVLPGLATVWSSALNVVPVQGAVVVDYTWCPFGQSTNAPFTTGVEAADLVVFVTANSEQCDGNGDSSVVLASAASCYWDQYERPTAGSIDFCLDAIDSKHLVSMGETKSNSGGNLIADEDESQLLLSELNFGEADPAKDHMLQMAIATSVHEFSHILGVTPHDFVFFYDSTTGAPRTPKPQQTMVECVSGQRERVLLPDENTLRQAKDRHGKIYYEVTLPTVTQVVQNHFDCPTLTGARLENQDDDSHCFGSHFEERLFFRGTSMNYVPEILSPLTLALLKDSGWYLPNFRVAKVSPFGHGAGCDFVDHDCIQNGKVPDFGDDFFCMEKAIVKGEQIGGTYGCNPSYSGIGVCDLVDYSEMAASPPPKMYQYFDESPNFGSLMATANYCPTYTMAATSCREMPSLNTGTMVPPLPDDAQALESDSHHAKCFPTVGADRPMCLDVACDDGNQVIKVKIGNDVLTCSYADEIWQVPGTDVQIKCPPLAVVCPGSICPANCAGNGVCDFAESRCRCNNQSDKSEGCYGMTSAIPPQFVRGGIASGATAVSTAAIGLYTAVTLIYCLG